jgi:hypothetical protein
LDSCSPLLSSTVLLARFLGLNLRCWLLVGVFSLALLSFLFLARHFLQRPMHIHLEQLSIILRHGSVHASHHVRYVSIAIIAKVRPVPPGRPSTILIDRWLHSTLAIGILHVTTWGHHTHTITAKWIPGHAWVHHRVHPHPIHVWNILLSELTILPSNLPATH